MRTTCRHLFATALLLGAAAVHAAPQYVAAGSPLPRFHLLKEGSHRYLRYLQAADSNTPIDIWQRDLRLDGKTVQLRQRWDAVGKTPSVKWLDSSFEAGSLRPLTHTRITQKDDRKTVEGFAFAPDKVTGLPDLPANTQKALAVALTEPVFNFEADIELLQSLPLGQGYEAELALYHPGGSAAPARYTFRVAGSELIAGPAGPVDCWVVTTDYNQPGTVSKFWFARTTQLMVRQESRMPDGRLLIKTLID